MHVRRRRRRSSNLRDDAERRLVEEQVGVEGGVEEVEEVEHDRLDGRQQLLALTVQSHVDQRAAERHDHFTLGEVCA